LRADSQTDLVRYRVFILADRGSRLLVIANGPRFALPEIQISPFARTAERLAAAMRRDWALEVICLYPAEALGGQPSERHLWRYYLTEIQGSQPTVRQGMWVSVSSLTEDSFSHGNDHQALLTFLARCCPSCNPHSAAFEIVGWFETVSRWISAVIKPSGLYLTGEFRQINASPAFSLIRFATNRQAVWFKAVGPPNVREFRITRYLAQIAPAFIPKILGARVKWNAWLMAEVEQSHPDDRSDMEIWATVAKTLARLQIASVGHSLHLMNAGCRDMRVGTVLDGLDRFFEVMAFLMSQQTKEVPPPLSQDELRTLATQLKALLIEFQEFDIPNALGHLDLNPSNIVVTANRCVFLDWAEAYVGHPFLTFHYLLQHLCRFQGLGLWETAVTSAYAQEWLALADPTAIRQALALSPLIAMLAYACSADGWRDPKHRFAPEVASYLRSLTRQIQRETRRFIANRNTDTVQPSAFAESQEIPSC
jgi:Phosphotransferase enzyme family